ANDAAHEEEPGWKTAVADQDRAPEPAGCRRVAEKRVALPAPADRTQQESIMRLSAHNRGPRRAAAAVRNGVRNGARGLRSAATFLPVRLREFFADLGPGLTTGAADDDPSGISTYSVTGASFGYAQLWTALFSFPLMVSVQLMCARLGMVTGRGLAGVIRRRYRRRVLWTACGLLAIANVFNIG